MGLFDRIKKKDLSQTETMLVPGVGRVPYPAYRGRKPYVFVSYAHADSARVFKEIARLNEAGFHVWYDEGISPGNEWTNEIADALANCTVFIVMLTPVSAPRENVQNEINFALDEKKPFLAVHLEETILRRGLKLQIGSKQAILKYNMTEEEYLYKLTEALTRFGLKQKPGKAAPAPSSDQYTAPPVQPEKAAKPVLDTASAEDFEWIGSTLKAYHGTQKRIEVPSRASKIMSMAFRDNPTLEYVGLSKYVSELSFSAFHKCPNLKEVVINNPQIRINYIPDSVAPLGAFDRCPQLTVYCHKDSATYEELKRTHTGEIRFIEDRE